MKKQHACPLASRRSGPAGRGSGLIFSVILLFVILGMVITLSSITVLETKMSQKTKSSVGAFYNSESGVEWALNQIANKSGSDRISSIGTVDGNAIKCPFVGDVCKVLFLDQDGNVLATSATIDQVKAVRSIGSQGSATQQRAIEAAVAAGGAGSYVAWGTTSCANDYKKVQSGKITYPYQADNNSANDVLQAPICNSKTLSGGHWQGTYEDTMHYMIPSSAFDCAVCAGKGTYTAWGTDQCDSDYNTAYSGTAIVYRAGGSSGTGSGGVGDAICSQTGVGNGGGSIMIWATPGGNAERTVLKCAVCASK